ncbi:MAG: PadR family transcriptional regulator, partial [Myxococcota bacterium]
MRKGVIELALLAALHDGEAYGYEILQRLDQREGLSMTESTVYPVLARLTTQGLLSVRKVPSPKGPPRRYYRLTATGQQRMRAMWLHFNTLHDAIEQLLQPSPSEARPP